MERRNFLQKLSAAILFAVVPLGRAIASVATAKGASAPGAPRPRSDSAPEPLEKNKIRKTYFDLTASVAATKILNLLQIDKISAAELLEKNRASLEKLYSETATKETSIYNRYYTREESKAYVALANSDLGIKINSFIENNPDVVAVWAGQIDNLFDILSASANKIKTEKKV